MHCFPPTEEVQRIIDIKVGSVDGFGMVYSSSVFKLFFCAIAGLAEHGTLLRFVESYQAVGDLSAMGRTNHGGVL